VSKGKKKDKGKAKVAGKGDKARAKSPKAVLPKSECCVSKDRCKRCPIRMLKEGTLPEGLTVKKRVLVTADGKRVKKKQLQKAA
jgi:hypothetical protein